MYCPNCGTENPDEVRFCGNCGAAFGAAPTVAEPIIPKTSGLAIAALILGILSLFTCALTAIPSIICGIISLIKIEKSGGKITGKGFAISGIILPVATLPILLMVILMPALSRVKAQARTVTCRANLRQWGLTWALYSQDHDGSFVPDENWLEPLRPYMHDNNKMLLCPMAAKSEGLGAGTTFTAWKTPEGDIGSYGINGWVTNPKRENIKSPGQIENYWKNARKASRQRYIPLMMDSRQPFAFPLETNPPPRAEDMELQSSNHMQRVCIDRHDGYINMAFMDGHVEGVGLNELWTLKWHRTYNTEGPWTKQGRVNPTDWPQWMINLRYN